MVNFGLSIQFLKIVALQHNFLQSLLKPFQAGKPLGDQAWLIWGDTRVKVSSSIQICRTCHPLQPEGLQKSNRFRKMLALEHIMQRSLTCSFSKADKPVYVFFLKGGNSASTMDAAFVRQRSYLLGWANMQVSHVTNAFCRLLIHSQLCRATNSLVIGKRLGQWCSSVIFRKGV